MPEDEKNLIRAIIDRVKKAEGVAYDKDIATPLRVSERNVAAWKERGTIPWSHLLEWARHRGVSFEWLINGRGPMRVDELQAVAESPAAYRVRCLDVAVLKEITEVVERHLAVKGIELPPEKRAYIISLLYEQAMQTDQVETTALPDLVALAS